MDYIDAIAGSAFGTAVTTIFAKLFIARSVKDLDAALSMCHEIKEELAAISVNMERLKSMNETLMDHDRKIAQLGEKLNARHSKSNYRDGE